jgi:hypothetical protein
VWNLLILLGSVGFLVNRNCSVQCISDLVLELVAVERSLSFQTLRSHTG